MSQLNKQQLGVENQTSFPNNTTGFISPALLRGFNTDVIDSFGLSSILVSLFTRSFSILVTLHVRFAIFFVVSFVFISTLFEDISFILVLILD
jgi:hypothetical protein